MEKDLAESFAADIERKELREGADRLYRYRILAAQSHGPEQEQFLRQAEAAEAELRQWRDLASLVRASADVTSTEGSDGLTKTGT